LKEDLFRVLDAMGDGVKDARDRALLLIGFAGGFRRSELVGLDLADIEHVRQGVVITLRALEDPIKKARVERLAYPTPNPALPSRRTRPLAFDVRDRPKFCLPAGRSAWRIAAEQLSGEAVSLIIKERVAAAGIDLPAFRATA